MPFKFLKFLYEFKSVHNRHVNITQDNIWHLAFVSTNKIERFLTVIGFKAKDIYVKGSYKFFMNISRY
jgi:hypothetical protein